MLVRSVPAVLLVICVRPPPAVVMTVFVPAVGEDEVAEGVLIDDQFIPVASRKRRRWWRRLFRHCGSRGCRPCPW